MDDLTCCPICTEEYDDDIDKIEVVDRSTSHLPVQSSKCSHFMCYSCVVGEQMGKAERDGTEPAKVKWLQCPECRQKTSFNTQQPIVSIMVCKMIKNIRQQRQDTKEQEAAARQDKTNHAARDVATFAATSHSGVPLSETAHAREEPRSESVVVEVAREDEERKQAAKSDSTDPTLQHQTESAATSSDDTPVRPPPLTKKTATRKSIADYLEGCLPPAVQEQSCWNLSDDFLNAKNVNDVGYNPLKHVIFNKKTNRYEYSSKAPKNNLNDDDFVLQAIVMCNVYRIQHGWGVKKLLRHFSVWSSSKANASNLSSLENLWAGEIKKLQETPKKEVKKTLPASKNKRQVKYKTAATTTNVAATGNNLENSVSQRNTINNKKVTYKFGKGLEHEDNYWKFIRYYVDTENRDKPSKWQRRSDTGTMMTYVHTFAEQAAVQFARSLGPDYGAIGAQVLRHQLHGKNKAVVPSLLCIFAERFKNNPAKLFVDETLLFIGGDIDESSNSSP